MVSAGGGVVSGVVVESGTVVSGGVVVSPSLVASLRGPQAASNAAAAHREIQIFVLMNAPESMAGAHTVLARAGANCR
jgi:hypothetical protein